MFYISIYMLLPLIAIGVLAIGILLLIIGLFLKNKRFLLGVVKFVVIAEILIVLNFHFAPVHFDTGACSGGYSSGFADQFSNELITMFMVDQGLQKKEDLITWVTRKDNEKGAYYEVSHKGLELLSTRDEILQSISWKGRKIFMTIKLKANERNYTVHYTG